MTMAVILSWYGAGFCAAFFAACHGVEHDDMTGTFLVYMLIITLGPLALIIFLIAWARER